MERLYRLLLTCLFTACLISCDKSDDIPEPNPKPDYNEDAGWLPQPIEISDYYTFSDTGVIEIDGENHDMTLPLYVSETRERVVGFWWLSATYSDNIENAKAKQFPSDYKNFKQNSWATLRMEDDKAMENCFNLRLLIDENTTPYTRSVTVTATNFVQNCIFLLGTVEILQSPKM